MIAARDEFEGLQVPAENLELLQQLRAKCADGEGDCWIWLKGCAGGRPITRLAGVSVYVRRLVRGLVDGRPVPEAKRTTAKCNDPRCVSPHCSRAKSIGGVLREAYQRGSRGAAIGRKIAATKRANSSISEEVVQAIRDAASGDIAVAQTGVSRTWCFQIRAGRARAPLAAPFRGLGKRR